MKKGLSEDIGPFDSFLEKCVEETIHPELVKEYFIQMCTYIDIAIHANLMDGSFDLQAAIDGSTSLSALEETMYHFFHQASQAILEDISLYRKEVI